MEQVKDEQTVTPKEYIGSHSVPELFSLMKDLYEDLHRASEQLIIIKDRETEGQNSNGTGTIGKFRETYNTRVTESWNKILNDIDQVRNAVFPRNAGYRGLVERVAEINGEYFQDDQYEHLRNALVQAAMYLPSIIDFGFETALIDNYIEQVTNAKNFMEQIKEAGNHLDIDPSIKTFQLHRFLVSNLNSIYQHLTNRSISIHANEGPEDNDEDLALLRFFNEHNILYDALYSLPEVEELEPMNQVLSDLYVMTKNALEDITVTDPVGKNKLDSVKQSIERISYLVENPDIEYRELGVDELYNKLTLILKAMEDDPGNEGTFDRLQEANTLFNLVFCREGLDIQYGHIDYHPVAGVYEDARMALNASLMSYFAELVEEAKKSFEKAKELITITIPENNLNSGLYAPVLTPA